MAQFIGFCILGIAALLWLIGGNVLVGYHYKRRGMPAESGFRPMAFPFKQFSAREWLWVAALAVGSVGLAGAGVHLLRG